MGPIIANAMCIDKITVIKVGATTSVIEVCVPSAVHVGTTIVM